MSDELPKIKMVTLEELRGSSRPMSVLERVESHALGMNDMTTTELAAAKLFLSKTQPDLKAMEVTGKDGGDIKILGRVVFVKPEPQ